jgi:hypothetical protein
VPLEDCKLAAVANPLGRATAGTAAVLLAAAE